MQSFTRIFQSKVRLITKLLLNNWGYFLKRMFQ